MGWRIARSPYCGVLLMLGMYVSTGNAAPVAPQTKASSMHTRGVIIIPADVPDQGGGEAEAKASVAPKTITPVTHSIMRHCDLPHDKSDLDYSGQADFDRSLSGVLKLGKPVIISVAAPYDESAPPPGALSSWFSAVKAAGGKVSLSTYCSASRGIGQGWFSNFIQHLTGSIYLPARNYDVTVFSDQTKHKITQIAFTPKSGATSAVGAT